MNLLEETILICWVILLAYWIISANKVKPTEEVKRNISGAWDTLGRIFLGFLFIESFGKFPLFPITASFIPHVLFLRWASTLLVIVGLVIAILARKTLADNWSYSIDVKKNHKLITTGIYSLARHPIYTGLIFMSFGLFVFTGTISAFIFFLIMFFFMKFKASEEEQLLTKHFPKEYSEYKKETKALIPFIW